MWCSVPFIGYVEKTHGVIWNALLDYTVGSSDKGPLKILRNTLDVGYNDEFDMVWYVKGLIASKTNVVVTWRDRPKMGSFTSSPTGPCFGVFPMVVLCCMVFVCNWVCSMCIKKKKSYCTLEAWSMCCLVIYFNWTPTCDWCVVRCRSKNKNHKGGLDYVFYIYLHASHSIVTTFGRTYVLVKKSTNMHFQ